MKKLVLFLIVNLTYSVVFSQSISHHVTLNPNSGYSNINEFTCGYGLGGTTFPYSKYFYGLTTIHGYQLNIYGLDVNRSLFGGIGTGFIFYNGGYLVPLYADVRFTLKNGKVSPYFYGDGGFLLNFEEFDTETRMFINGGGGLRTKINENMFANFSAGLQIQMGNNKYRDAFVNLKIGIGFKPK